MGDFTTKEKNELILSFKRNDETVLKDLYLKVYPKAKSYVLKNNGNEEQAKDVFQEAFIICWRNIKEDKFEPHENLEAYLITIVKNKWIDYLRSAKYKKTVSINGISLLSQKHESDAVQDESQNQRTSVLQALKQLNSNCQEILNMYYFERLSMKQISTHLGIGSASVRNKKYRCIEQLRSLTRRNQKE